MRKCIKRTGKEYDYLQFDNSSMFVSELIRRVAYAFTPVDDRAWKITFSESRVDVIIFPNPNRTSEISDLALGVTVTTIRYRDYIIFGNNLKMTILSEEKFNSLYRII